MKYFIRPLAALLLSAGMLIAGEAAPPPAPPSAPAKNPPGKTPPAAEGKEAPAADAKTVYITKSGKKYHAEGCRYLKNSSTAVTLKEALKNYTACSVCRP